MKAAVFVQTEDEVNRKLTLTEGQMNFILKHIAMLQGGNLQATADPVNEIDYSYPDVIKADEDGQV